MAESITSRMATLSGGISKLKAEVRSPGQVENALNTDFSLQQGCAKRPGTAHVFALGATAPTSTWLIAKAVSAGVRPIVYTGSDGTVRILNDSTYVEGTVQMDPAVTAYLATTATTRPNCAGLDDEDVGVLRIANPGVTPLATRSDAVLTSGQRNTYSALEAFTPTAAGQVWKAKEASDGRPAGLYRYSPGIGTFARAQFAEHQAGGGAAPTETNYFCRYATNPRGFRLFYSRFIANSATIACTSTTTAGGATVDVLDMSGVSTALAYQFQAGDQVYVEGGGATAGAYPLAGAAFGFLTLTGATGGTGTNVNVRGIGRMVEITENFFTAPVASMDDAAVRYTQALRDAGLTNACVHWEWTDFAVLKGKFTITAGDGGPTSGFSNATYTVFAPTIANTFNDTAAGNAFNLVPALTAGTGAFENFTTVPKDRWEPIAFPGQNDAVLNAATMPVRVRKVLVTGYDETAIDLGAWHYFRLGDSSLNTTAADRCGNSIGTYGGTPTRGVASLAVGETDKATTFAAASSQYVTSTAWWAMGSRDRVTVEMLVQTNVGAGEKCLFHLRQTNDLYITIGKTQANRITVYAGSGEYRCDVANFNNSATKHLAVVCFDDTATVLTRVAVYVNGVAQAMTKTTEVTSDPTVGTTQGACTIDIGRRHDATMYFTGTIDEVAVYPFAFNAATIAYRYAQSLNTATGDLWAVEQTPWEPRLTGDSTTNPVPSFIRTATPISAMTVWEGRLGTGAGRVFGTTRAQNETAWFVQDTATITDAAPIDRIVTGTDASKIVSLTPFGSVCVALTDGPKQYELSAANALSIGTLNARVGFNQRVAAVEPAQSGDRLYIVAPTAQGNVVNATTLEATIDEQAVAGSYDDIGQHVHGLINPASVDDLILATVTSDGKIILIERGGSRLFVYQTAYVAAEKRQSSWTVWNIGGTIQSACAIDETILLTVLRSGKYVIEKWKPEPPEQWPASGQRIDGRVSVVGGTFTAGSTTFTMPTNVPATGIDTVVLSDGTERTATPISATQFTVGGTTLSGVTVTAGRSYAAYVTLSRPYQKDQNGQAYISPTLTLGYVILTATDLTKIAASVTVDSRAPTTWPVRALNFDTKRGRAWTRGPVQRTTVTLTLSGAAPVSIGTLEQVLDAVASRT